MLRRTDATRHETHALRRLFGVNQKKARTSKKQTSLSKPKSCGMRRGDQMAGKKGRSGRKKKTSMQTPKTSNGQDAKRQEGYCSFCKRTRPSNYFHAHKGRSTGLSNVCVDCIAKAQRLARYKKIIQTQGTEAIIKLIEESERKTQELRQTLEEYKQKEGIEE